MKTADQVAMEEAVEVAYDPEYSATDRWSGNMTVEAWNNLCGELIATIEKQEAQIKKLKKLEERNVGLKAEVRWQENEREEAEAEVRRLNRNRCFSASAHGVEEHYSPRSIKVRGRK